MRGSGLKRLEGEAVVNNRKNKARQGEGEQGLREREGGRDEGMGKRGD